MKKYNIFPLLFVFSTLLANIVSSDDGNPISDTLEIGETKEYHFYGKDYTVNLHSIKSSGPAEDVYRPRFYLNDFTSRFSQGKPFLLDELDRIVFVVDEIDDSYVKFTIGIQESCGDGVCDTVKENCHLCPKDCGCGFGYNCVRGDCIKVEEKPILLVVDDKSKATDIITITDIVAYLIGHGYEYRNIGSAKLNSEITQNMLDHRLITFVYNNQSVIILGENSLSEHAKIAELIQWFLENKKGIKAKIKSSDDIKSDDLKDALEKETLIQINSKRIDVKDSNEGINAEGEGQEILANKPKEETQEEGIVENKTNESEEIPKISQQEIKETGLVQRIINWFINLFG